MNRLLSALAAAALTTGALTLAAPAHAAPADDDVVSVSLAGLDSANPADAARIDRRIRSAAQSLCGSKLIQPVRMRERAAACEEAVTADARGAVELAAAKQSTPFRLALRIR